MIWVLADTHFGHDKLRGPRHPDFEKKILKGMLTIPKGDTLIHLGDVCMGDDEFWHYYFMPALLGVNLILVRGNHDNKSDSWYYKHGWSAVCDRFDIEKYGHRLMFTHRPFPIWPVGPDNWISVHGHLHDCSWREKPWWWKEESHRLVNPEENLYPISLRSLIKK